jgi:monofunctional biosynthetic peptidoglycan transglycosylase
MRKQTSPKNPPHKTSRFHRLLLVLLLVFIALLIWTVAPAVFINTGRLKTDHPRRTALMTLREKQAKAKGKSYRLDQRWVPLSKISRHLREAVRVSEDAAFFSHSGVDWDEARETFEYNWKKKSFARGASTITMQLARNLYLTPSKNPIRKLQEIAITYRLEKSLSKSRILELYLNIVEWGDGIFGAEAAAQRYFGVSAAGLDASQAARLAAVLPSPLRWNPTSNQKVVLRRQAIILKRMGK